MTESEAIKFAEEQRRIFGGTMNDFLSVAITALEEVQQYNKIDSVDECIKNKDFLDFLSDKMNPNDFETYLRLYNALEEKGCEE